MPRAEAASLLDRPRIVTIETNRKETDIVDTITFKDLKGAPAGRPGQFLMVWAPGVDEVPMSLTIVGERKAFAFHKKGQATEALHALKKGDRFGVRGPYGHGFDLGKAKKVLAIGGGTGVAALASLIGTKGIKLTFAIGAKTAGELLYNDRIKRSGCELIVTTDDGTRGRKGFVSVASIELLKERDFDLVATCGREIMMLKIIEACTKARVPVQCSTERFMKCGIGICDSCSMGGLQVCRDGPVLSGKQLLAVEEFGKWKRGPSGGRERLC